jgi:hypothetical protein
MSVGLQNRDESGVLKDVVAAGEHVTIFNA